MGIVHLPNEHLRVLFEYEYMRTSFCCALVRLLIHCIIHFVDVLIYGPLVSVRCYYFNVNIKCERR